jgi:hypothetical protein
MPLSVPPSPVELGGLLYNIDPWGGPVVFEAIAECTRHHFIIRVHPVGCNRTWHVCIDRSVVVDSGPWSFRERILEWFWYLMP